jgi:hypothetical protein
MKRALLSNERVPQPITSLTSRPQVCHSEKNTTAVRNRYTTPYGQHLHEVYLADVEGLLGVGGNDAAHLRGREQRLLEAARALYMREVCKQGTTREEPVQLINAQSCVVSMKARF